jgi:alpha-1,6-mannosyltransferase
MIAAPMTICDLSPFYCEKGGGIRTYHRARIDWFTQQTRHRYVLISPGPCFQVSRVAPTVSLVQVYGPPLTRDADRYRLLLDYPTVSATIEQVRPDILEANDLWFSAPFGLLLRRRRVFGGLLTSFCHSDPVTTYIEPRMSGLNRGRHLAEGLRAWTDRMLGHLQARLDMTFVASESMRSRLRCAGVENVVKVGFGVEPELLAMRRSRPGTVRRRRLLYIGRLDDDKEFGLLLDVLPEVLRRPDVLVTVVGAGRHQRRVAAMSHPRFRYLGFVSDRLAIRTIYAANDVLLAPGRFETFGLAVLEAAAAGLVVVGPDQGGTGELLGQMQSPLAFDAGDRRAFLDRIVASIEGEIAPLAERSRAVAARYGTWHDSVARHVAVYETMLRDGATEALGRPA